MYYYHTVLGRLAESQFGLTSPTHNQTMQSKPVLWYTSCLFPYLMYSFLTTITNNFYASVWLLMALVDSTGSVQSSTNVHVTIHILKTYPVTFVHQCSLSYKEYIVMATHNNVQIWIFTRTLPIYTVRWCLHKHTCHLNFGSHMQMLTEETLDLWLGISYHVYHAPQCRPTAANIKYVCNPSTNSIIAHVHIPWKYAVTVLFANVHCHIRMHSST